MDAIVIEDGANEVIVVTQSDGTKQNVVLETSIEVVEIAGGGGGGLGDLSSINDVGGVAQNIDITIPGFQKDNDNSVDGSLIFKEIIPITVNLNGGSTNEVGQTIASVNLTWSYNESDTDPDTSQTLNNGIGALPVAQRSFLYSTPITSDTTFTLDAVDSVRGSDSDSTSVRFGYRIYSGVTTSSVLDSATIIADATDNNIELGSNANYDATYDCSGGRYFYYAYPASWGELSTSATKVGGLTFSDWSDNAGGVSPNGFLINIVGTYSTTSYRVYRVRNLQNSAAIEVDYRE